MSFHAVISLLFYFLFLSFDTTEKKLLKHSQERQWLLQHHYFCPGQHNVNAIKMHVINHHFVLTITFTVP